MTTFEFRCDTCKVTLKDKEYPFIFESMKPKEAKCPNCKKIGSRIFTAPAFGYIGPSGATKGVK